ncbi:hypothetical protein NP493_418g02043 [Ridgeia piscesae]|uniref:Riboflavin transporter n=1 Tax=Ridgeia piscesae TaxID=27915 RepID=A0AAD9NSC7_RIDPI|nr:hypothetical protein NP493_418g02043 [Ridgeia piscesae]
MFAVADSLSSRTDLLVSDDTDENASDAREATGCYDAARDRHEHTMNSDDMETSRTTVVAVYIGVAIVGLGSSFVTNALWVLLPLLTQRTPEGAALPVYLLLVFECSHVVLVAYLVVRRCSRSVISDVPFVYSSYVLSLAALVLLGVFWQHSVDIATRPHSFLLLMCALLGAVVACVSTVTYAGFAARLRTRYMSAIVLGDVLSGVVPHLLSVAQGVGRATDCLRQPVAEPTNHTAAAVHGVVSGYVMETLSSTPVVQLQTLRYSESTFFFLGAAFLLASAVAFVNFRCSDACRTQYDAAALADQADIELRGLRRDHATNSLRRDRSYVLDDGSIRHVRACPSTSIRSADHTRYYDRRKSRDSNGADARRHCTVDLIGCDVTTDTSHMTHHRDSAVATGASLIDRPKLFPLLIVITLWVSSVLHGPASVVKAHACYPTANGTFRVGSIVSDVFLVLACPLATRCMAKSRVTFIVAFTALGTIVVFYFAALVWFSRTVDGAKDSLLFGDPGELLATIAWVTVSGLFSYARALTAIVCRDASSDAVLWYACVTQLGAALGSLTVLDNIGICVVYQAKMSCD